MFCMLPCSTGAFIPKSVLPVGKENTQQGNSGEQNKVTQEGEGAHCIERAVVKQVCESLHTKHVLDACDLERMTHSEPSTVCSV